MQYSTSTFSKSSFHDFEYTKHGCGIIRIIKFFIWIRNDIDLGRSKKYSPVRKFSNFASSMSHDNNAKGFEFPRSVRRPYPVVSYNTFCPQKYDFTYEKWRREGYIEISARKIAARCHYIFFITGKRRRALYLYFPMSGFVDSQTHKEKIWSVVYLLYRVLVFRFGSGLYIQVGAFFNTVLWHNGAFFYGNYDMKIFSRRRINNQRGIRNYWNFIWNHKKNCYRLELGRRRCPFYFIKVLFDNDLLKCFS